MHVLFAHNNADLYGSSRSLARLSGRLVRDGHVVRVVLPCAGPFKTLLEGKGVEVVVDATLSVVERPAFRSPIRLARFLVGLSLSVRRFRRQIRDFRPDVVHTNTSVIPTPGMAARREGVPHVWHVRECYTEFPRLWPFYCRHILRYSNCIVCISRAVAQQFDTIRKDDRVRTVHNGYPEQEFSGVPTDRVKAFRERYGLRDEELLVGVVGRIKLKRKGQEVFVDAAARLAKDYPQARFLIIGSVFPGNESHLEALRRQVASLGLADRVVFTGEVDDINAAYEALDIVVVPSAMPEPFGGVVVEGMAFSKPVVSTTIGGPPEIVDDGSTGLLVEPGNAEALAGALARLLDDCALRTAMGVAGRRRYLERFTMEPFYDRILSIYESATRTTTIETAGDESRGEAATDRMRVLLVHDFYQNFGGEDSIALREKELLESHGFDVHFYCRHNTDIHDFGWPQKLGFIPQTISSGRTRREVQRIVDRFRPDVAYVHNVFPLVSPSVYRVLRANGVPVCQNIQDFRWLCPNGLFYRRGTVCERCRKGAYWNAVRYKCFRDSYGLSLLYACAVALNRAAGTLKRIDGILCVTPYSRQKFADAGVPEDHLFIKPNFVHAPPAPPEKGTKDYAVFLGRLSVEKGLWTLIRAFETMPDVPLRIVGTGPIENELRDHVRERGLSHIRFEGFKEGDAKTSLLQNAAFMVFTSEWYEHFPIVLLEAFAGGIPVIASRIGNMPYIVKNGETGLWYEVGDADDLRAKVRALMADKEKIREMGKTARRLVDSAYTAEENVRLLRDVFAAVSGKKHPLRVDP